MALVALLIAATVTTGLVAGAFVLYAHTVMPGLGHTDDHTFVTTFASLDRAIINPWFMAGGFLGAPVLMAAAAVAGWGGPAFWWVTAALALYLVGAVLTIAVNVPLNDRLKAAVAAGDTDTTRVRVEFDEPRWVRSNLVRTATTMAAFVLLCWALVEAGSAR